MNPNRSFTPCENCAAPANLAELVGTSDSMTFQYATNLVCQRLISDDVVDTFDEEVERSMRLNVVPESLRADVVECSKRMLAGECVRDTAIAGRRDIIVKNGML